MARRDFIRVIGAGGALTLVGCDRMPDAAVAAWRGPDAETELRRRLLRYAILAPNPHNMQPWLADLREPETIVLRCDRTRLLPETDPYGRQVMIGHGTFLELLAMAAAEAGWRADIATFPEGAFGPGTIDDRPVARVRLARDPAVRPDPLFRHALARRSTKTAFEDRPLDGAHAAALAELGLAVTREPERVAALRAIVTEAWDIEATTPRTHLESVERMRIGADQVAEYRDGIDLTGPLFWWGRRLGFTSRAAMADPTSFAFSSGMGMYHDMFAATPAFGWLASGGNSRADQLAAGRTYLRMNLAAAGLGVAVHPVSQVLQEYPEMAALQRRFLETVGERGRTVQMLVRLGYAERPGPSPRRALDDIIV